jgi:hypothetical protein
VSATALVPVVEYYRLVGLRERDGATVMANRTITANSFNHSSSFPSPSFRFSIHPLRLTYVVPGFGGSARCRPTGEYLTPLRLTSTCFLELADDV